jgi:osmotically-inducible protein OsmY
LADKISPVRLGTRVCFDDRWQGRVSGLEVDEDWEVLNISVSSGILFASSSVRLPFSAVTSFSDDAVRIAANSFQAFAREVPPVAAPARPLDSRTPISHPGAKFAGLVVQQMDRRVREVIVSRGVSGLFRVPVSDVSFTGKTMTIAVPPEQLVQYHPDHDIGEAIQEMLAEDTTLPTEDKRHIQVDVEDGVVTLSGNVRVDYTRDYAGTLAADADGVVALHNELRHDFEIEAAIGMALTQSGQQNTGKVYVRSNLGEVLVDGFVPTQRAAEDAVRAVAKVPGVRSVVNRLHIGAPVAA